MTKYMIAILAVSVSVFAVACGGAQEPAKTEGAAPAADTSAAPATPPAADTGAAPAAPAAEAPKN